MDAFYLARFKVLEEEKQNLCLEFLMQKTLTDLSVIQKMSQQQQVWSTPDCIKAKSMFSS